MYVARSTRAHGARISLAALGLAAALPSAVQAQAYTLQTLTSFNGDNGSLPRSGLTLSGGALYGTLQFGGANNKGAVFSLPVGGGAPTTLASFNTTGGYDSEAGLTLSGGTLYGTTAQGGQNNDGTVFSLPVGAVNATPTTLASFNGTNGQEPFAGLTLSADGKTLYGTAVQGGANNEGTVFSLPVGGGAPTTLASFNLTNGATPYTGLTLSGDGKTLYGTTAGGGASGDGTVFSVPVGGGALTVLASFNLTNGADPFASLTLSGDGKTLYGTTAGGGASGDGTVFSVPVGAVNAAPTTLVSFNGTNGEDPYAGLTLSADGRTLYGTTAEGGNPALNNGLGYGTVFALTLAAPEPFGWASLGIGCLGLVGLAFKARKRA